MAGTADPKKETKRFVDSVLEVMLLRGGNRRFTTEDLTRGLRNAHEEYIPTEFKALTKDGEKFRRYNRFHKLFENILFYAMEDFFVERFLFREDVKGYIGREFRTEYYHPKSPDNQDQFWLNDMGKHVIEERVQKYSPKTQESLTELARIFWDKRR